MPTIHRLSNGVTVICEPRKEPGNVAMQINIGVGAGHDDASETGLTSLMVNTLHGGTAKRSREQIMETLASKGAGFGSDVDADETIFTGQCRGSDVAAVFDILGDIIRNPVFDANEIKRTQWMTAQHLDSRQQDPDEIVSDLFDEALYGQQTSARTLFGDKALIDSFTPSQVKKRHTAFLAHPEKIIVSFAGDIDEAEALRLADAHFGDLKPAMAPLPPVPSIFIGGDLRQATAHEQLNLKIAFPAPAAFDQQRYNIMMFNQLFGGGMSSPLFMEIREKRGLVYGVGSGYGSTADSGRFQIGAGSGGNARELLTETLRLIGDIAQKGFTQDELDTARKSLVSNARMTMEKAEKQSLRNGSLCTRYGFVPTFEQMEDALSQVTSAGIQNAVATMLAHGKYALAAVGPIAGLPSEQEIKDLMAEQVKKIPVTQPHAPAKTISSVSAAFNNTASAVTTIADPQMTVLPNGITVVTAERPGSLACGAWGVAGSDHEAPDENGSAHMIEHMMFRGTPSYPPGSISRIVEQDLNGKLNAYTSTDRVAYYFYNLRPDSLEKTIDICGEMVFKADINEKEYAGYTTHNPDGTVAEEKGERSAVLEEIKQYSDEVGSRLRNKLSELSYLNQSSGRTILGTAEVLTKISATKLTAYRDKYYAPNNFKFVAAGPIRHQDFVDLIERKFGHLTPGTVPVLPTPVYHGGTAAVEMTTATMCEIMIAAEGVNATHKDAMAYSIMARILGGGPTSRLYKEITLRLQLSHGVGAGAQMSRNCGRFLMGGATEPKNAKQVVAAMYGELRRLAIDVTQTELDKVKAQIETGLMLSLETSQGSCNANATDTLVYGKPRTNAEKLAEVQKVTLEDVKRVAALALRSNPSAAFVVPPGVAPALLPTHAEIIAMRDGSGGAPAAVAKPAGPSAGPQI